MIITLCGSNKYKKEIMMLKDALRKLGFYVNPPAVFESDKEFTENEFYQIQKGLLLGHFEKIKKSDVVIICNFYGYTGNSTTLELGYAKACNKNIISIEHDCEMAKEILYDITILRDNLQERLNVHDNYCYTNDTIMNISDSIMFILDRMGN